MSRLSIEISDHQHQKIKAMAAISGLSIKDYILEKTLPTQDEAYNKEEIEALERLKEFLAPRIKAAKRGEFLDISLNEILSEIYSARGI
ncbi:MAG: antitoxin [Rickettsiales bacterium]